MDEETGVLVEPLELLTVFDRIQREGERVVHHYVIVDYLCAWRGGEGRAGSDAEEARWVSPDELDRFDLPAKAREVVEEALRRSAGRTGGREALPPGGSRR
jgi:ADP-ribose pyrophosphatase YjhB (NUDIX family)